MPDTIGYYQEHAEDFVESTFDVAMDVLYSEFLPLIPRGGHILDAGCGSGRDAYHFHRKGFIVSAFDGALAIVELAGKKTGLAVKCRQFSEITEEAVYDGIWACASLLHLPADQIPGTIERLWRALRPSGSLYMSFKIGDGERSDNGRHFTDANEVVAKQWISGIEGLANSRFWRTRDQRQDRSEEWLNILLTKQPEPYQKLITGGENNHFLPKLCRAINRANRIDMAVAFIKTTGLNLLFKDLTNVLERTEHPVKLRVLTSDYLDITDPEALRKLMLLQDQGAQVRVYQSLGSSFHMKAYLFSGANESDGHWGRAYIGSSNLSRQALQDGLEWNYEVSFPPDTGYLEAVSRFDELFVHAKSQPLSDAWIDAYEARRQPPTQSVAPGSIEQDPPPNPTTVQKEALAALDATRQQGYSRGLVVLATGLGKTWLSAFDAVQLGARRILFVAHREEILYQAAETFLRIKPSARVGFYMGQQRDATVDILCASVQTIGRAAHLELFNPRHFDYIVVDEFHHAAAPTYRRLLNHFAPQFLLGLTATPDRTDRSDILSLCDDNLVYEYPLFDGVRSQHLVPFHYYGIFDDDVDYTEIPWRNGKFDHRLLANKLATLGRARHALRQWRQYRQSRTLAFCVSRQHAEFMSEQFSKDGERAAAVHGESALSRGEALEQLEQGKLDIIFSVDLFSEGVDLPSIDTVLLLRPTESKILFLQQIGRGLRHSPGKSQLVIIDFVGNHQSFLHKPQALMGQAMNHRQLADFGKKVEQDRLDLPDGCFINYDLAIIDFLKGLDAKGPYKDYLALRDTLGRRPTLTEYYHFGGNLTQTRKQHGSWVGLLSAMGDLSDEESAVARQHGGFFVELEITSMTKSFKMILLEAFQGLRGWVEPPTLEDLASASWHALKRRPRLFFEISESVRDADGRSKDWQRYWKRNPVDHWTNKNSSPFRVDGQKFVPAFNVEIDRVSEFESIVQEILDYRLASYEARASVSSDVLAAEVTDFPSRPGTELPYFPTLKIACGHFRSSRAEAEEYRRLDNAYGRLDPTRHFIARASGNSMNGGKIPVRDGDYLLLEQINPTRAGSITGKTLAIERVDEAGDTQYLLRKVLKNEQGQYTLRAANPDYQDIHVTPEMTEEMRTFARLIAVVDPL